MIFLPSRNNYSIVHFPLTTLFSACCNHVIFWHIVDTQEACIEKASNESKDKPQEMWREGMNSPYSVDDSSKLQ